MSSSKPSKTPLPPSWSTSLSLSDNLLHILLPYRHFIAAFPFLFFAFESLLAVAFSAVYANSDWMLKMMFAQLLAVNATLAGLLHFFPPLYHFYTSMIFVPFQDFWLYSSGIALVAGGLLVAFSATQVIGAWILVAVLIIIFPGSIACVFWRYPRNQVCGGSLLGAILRLPFQFSFIAWAYWFTSPPLPVSF